MTFGKGKRPHVMEAGAREDVRARRQHPWSRARDAVVVLAEYAAETVYGFAHPEWRVSGAAAHEMTERLPGDDVVPQPNWQATRATSIACPPGYVWPWLAQAGYGRGGWYGDMPWWKDPDGSTGPRSSAAGILAGHQTLHEGDILLDGPNCNAAVGAWRVVQLDPGRAMVLYSSRTLSGREVLPGTKLPRSYFSCSWAFILRPELESAARLIVRSRACYHPGWMVRAAAVIRSGDTVMQRAMLAGIKRRAERAYNERG
ncbi:hypothetical protein LFT44_11300 [Arthrobacter sp. FW306-05-C]|uniref:hypothetical protein n=1 Tax=Arthrobacter sp. FW306-05-C TaxID=2879620 RepID=UPI001F228D9D|nr:hypothetical protein [Arthrobacter sp. FW306-05-C]UKA65131.1 hypothetical protein LFT44_11300 [Arthrobacter sp. FW306-05-C]